MSYEYINEKRESEPHALPDVEIFEHEKACLDGTCMHALEDGFYYAHGFPGCLWDSDPVGPFETYSIALEQAREDSGVYDQEDSNE